MDIDNIQQEVIELFDSRVGDLSQEDYRDLCENLASDFECRYEAVREELERTYEGE